MTTLLLLKETCWINYETKETTEYRQMWEYTRNVRVYLTFSLHWEKAMRRRGEKKKKAGSFLLNPTQREISLIMWLWFGCPGKSTLNQGDDGWLNIWNNGLIVIKMTVIKMDGSPCAEGLRPLVKIQNECMLEWEVLSVSEKTGNRETLLTRVIMETKRTHIQ